MTLAMGIQNVLDHGEASFIVEVDDGTAHLWIGPAGRGLAHFHPVVRVQERRLEGTRLTCAPRADFKHAHLGGVEPAVPHGPSGRRCATMPRAPVRDESGTAPPCPRSALRGGQDFAIRAQRDISLIHSSLINRLRLQGRQKIPRWREPSVGPRSAGTFQSKAASIRAIWSKAGWYRARRKFFQQARATWGQTSRRFHAGDCPRRPPGQ